MIKRIFPVIASALLLSGGCAYRHSDIRTKQLLLNKSEMALLKRELYESGNNYDTVQKMIWAVTKEKHYHSDLDSGTKVHDTRSSVQYAAALLHTGDAADIQRSIAITRAILLLQEKDTALPFCGVWPYYPEDPMKGRKAPVDYNWADFISLSLIDIVLNADDHLDKELKEQLKNSLILAAHAIMKRDVKADYTNICIMGTYVCYVVGNLYDQPDIRHYGKQKLSYFYDYTKNSKGFTEYNSPTYTIVAMNELLRMKQAVANPADSRMVNELYNLCWNMIARHFHPASGQWCGPYFRAYNDLLTPDLKQLLFYASKGRMALPGNYPKAPRVLEPHEIPEAMLPAFLQQQLPRTTTDTFLVGKYQLKNQVTYPDTILPAKDVVGKLYVHPLYALASVNQGYLWNQCRPLLAHWGTPAKPSYLRVRFLHDMYDFAAIHIKSVQDASSVLSVLNLAYNGGDKHPSIDRIKNGAIAATDLRLRIETGGNISTSAFSLSSQNKNELLFSSGLTHMVIRIPYCNWNDLEGHWEIGEDGNKKWADYVIYSGGRKTFDFTAMQEAVIGVSLSVSTGAVPATGTDIKVDTNSKYLRLSGKGLMVQALKKPGDEFRIKNDFQTDSK